MKCIIYTRVSTVDQNVQNQSKTLTDYAAKQNWRVIEVISDTASGGKSAEERQGLKKVFELAHRRKFDVLLFWSLDRFSREGSRRTLEYLTRLDSYGVKWHSYTEQYISSLGIFSDAIISILSCLAKQERIRISERTKAGLERIRGTVKLGRPRTAPALIAKAKQLRSCGKSYSSIGQALGLSKARAYQLCQED